MPMGRRLFFLSAACIVLPAILTGCGSAKKIASHTTVVRKPAAAPKVALHNGFPVRKVTSFSADELKRNTSFTTSEPITDVSTQSNTSIAAAHEIPSSNYSTTPTPDTLQRIEPKAITPEASYVATQKTAPHKQKSALAHENGESVVVSAAEMIQPTDPLLGKYAAMVNVDTRYIGNPQLYRFIDEWYGTEYKYGGEDNTGIDCSAFSQKLYDEVYNVGLLRTSRQQHRESDHFKHIEDAMQGDLVFFRVRRFRISHVGVYLANGYFVHASSSQGVVISNLNDRYWHRRYAGCGRVEKDNSPASESQFTP